MKVGHLLAPYALLVAHCAPPGRAPETPEAGGTCKFPFEYGWPSVRSAGVAGPEVPPCEGVEVVYSAREGRAVVVSGNPLPHSMTDAEMVVVFRDPTGVGVVTGDERVPYYFYPPNSRTRLRLGYAARYPIHVDVVPGPDGWWIIARETGDIFVACLVGSTEPLPDSTRAYFVSRSTLALFEVPWPRTGDQPIVRTEPRVGELDVFIDTRRRGVRRLHLWRRPECQESNPVIGPLGPRCATVKQPVYSYAVRG